MSELQSEFLFEIVLDIPPGLQLGAGPIGARVIAPFAGGTFAGPKLSGKVAPGGADWLLVRGDGSMAIDVRVTLEPSGGGLIYSSYGGRIVVPPEHMGAVVNPETVESVDPALYYFRSNPLFEVATDSPHAWLNGVVAVGVGRFTKTGVAYGVYAIK